MPRALGWAQSKNTTCFLAGSTYTYVVPERGRIGFDGDEEAKVAGRGAAGLVKSGTIVIANNDDYAYAYAA
jgi:hypothetical protein